MSNPGLPDHVRKHKKELYEEVLKRPGFRPYGEKGGRSAAEECDRILGITSGMTKNWLKSEESKRRRGDKHFLPDISGWKPAKPKVRVQAGQDLPPEYVADPEQKPTVRVRYEPDHHDDISVVAIGDAHDSPDLPDKSRFRWAGRYVADEKPDVVVQIGDMLTMNSINSYDQPGSKEYKALPTFPEDISSGEEAFTAFDEGLNGYECDKHITGGNHEDRVFSFESRNPQVANMFQLELDRLWGRHGWSYSLYSQPTFFGGVAFSHVPLSIMSRPIGGELATQNIAQKSIHDWVYGHSHRADVARRPKLGGHHITAVNLGCFLPQGHIESYVKHGSMTGWWYGIWTLRISKGRIQSYRQLNMDELEDRYG